MRLLTLLLVSFLIISCKDYSLKKKYESLHDKYRTLWYRTDKDCFFDSCKKYGELYDSLDGYKKTDFKIGPDTITVNEQVDCN